MTLKHNVVEFKDERKYVAYPENRAGYEDGRAIFSWRTNEWGQLALVALAFFVRSCAEDLQLTKGSNYKRFGITAATTYQFLRRAVPEVFDEYERVMGKPMARNLPMKRVYMWFLKQDSEGGCVKKTTDEHPFQWASAELLTRASDRRLRAG